MIFSASGPVSADHSLYYPDAGGFSLGPNALIGDPGFADPSSDDFRLTRASIAVDAGTDHGYEVDLDGTPIVGVPDLGPLECSP